MRRVWRIDWVHSDRDWTCLAIGRRELDLDDLVCPVVNGRSPTAAGVPLRTGGQLLFPIDEKVTGIEAGLLTGLPVEVLAGWTHQINLVVPLALHQEFCVDIASIDNMFGRQKLFALKLGMNGCRHGIIRDRSRCGFHMGHNQWQMSFTGFSQMHFVSNPGRASFLAVMSLFVIGRTDVTRGRRNILRRTPTNHIINALIILDPHLAQDFDCRNLAEPLRSSGIKERIKQFSSLLSQFLRQKLTRSASPSRGTRIFAARTVALHPL